jgi:L-lysine 2,3-aminomutase
MHYKAAYDTLNQMKISSWQEELRETSQDPSILLRQFGLKIESLQQAFPFKATQSYLDRIDINNPADPLLRQILPQDEEHIQHEGYSKDPVGDLDTQTVPGLLHKYHGRVLLITTGACAVHCRYCFRRHFPYADSNPAQQNWQPALEYIHADKSIAEVILSGGDPLMLSDNKLARLFAELAAIPHVKRLRIHSRVPTVLPSRINESLLALFQDLRPKPVMVLHTNHVNEIDESVEHSLARLKSSGLPILNQSVLLQGVNDSSQVLAELNEKLFDCGVLPYYLHMLDSVQGAAHFAVTEERAREIMLELRLALPGYLVPRLVREEAGAPYKLPLL